MLHNRIPFALFNLGVYFGFDLKLHTLSSSKKWWQIPWWACDLIRVLVWFLRHWSRKESSLGKKGCNAGHNSRLSSMTVGKFRGTGTIERGKWMHAFNPLSLIFHYLWIKPRKWCHHPHQEGSSHIKKLKTLPSLKTHPQGHLIQVIWSFTETYLRWLQVVSSWQFKVTILFPYLSVLGVVYSLLYPIVKHRHVIWWRC